MRMKCYWEKTDVVGGLLVTKRAVMVSPPINDQPFMIITRGLCSGEGEYSLAELGSGEVIMATFMPRKGLAKFLTENDYEPLGHDSGFHQTIVNNYGDGA